MAEEKLGGIDALRREVEESTRFKTAFQGYDKAGVNSYLKRLKAEHAEETVAFEDRLADREREITRLLERLGRMEQDLAELRAARTDAPQEDTQALRKQVSVLTEENDRLRTALNDISVHLAALKREADAIGETIEENKT